MLSAVENHFGPSRSYATGTSHYGSSNNPGGHGANNNLIAAPCPIIALPPPMSATEFARPHPKPNRFNGGQSLRNGLSSPARQKYSQVDQSVPVNLAVSQSLSLSENVPTSMNGLSMGHKQNEAASLTAAAKPSSLESEQDAISSSIASLYQHKLAYCPPDATTPLYYPNFYARPPTSSVYGTHSLYGPHPPPHSTHGLVNGRSSLHHSVAYPHVDSYSSPYLFGPTAYSPPAPTRPGLSPHSPIGTITVGTASQNSTNSSISAQSVLQTNASPLSVSPPSLYAQQQREQQYHMKISSQTEHNSSVGKNHGGYRSECKDKEMKMANHLNGKADFKIPSGKEGSLKHRILIRPDLAAKPSQKTSSSNGQSNSTNKPSSRSSSNNNNVANSKNKNLTTNGSSNFSKGSLIELSTGELKRVEDMRTEDFIISSSKNPNLQLIDTTVVKIASQSKNLVVITLSYNNNNKIYFETQPSHPFFVYGKGWASYSPDSAFNEHGLKCQPLEVGDVCISLTPREQPKQQQQQKKPSNSTSDTISPQNLSRKHPTHTIPTTATSTAVSSRPFSTFELAYHSQRHSISNQECLQRKYAQSMAPPSSTPLEYPSNAHVHEAIDATMHSRKRRTTMPETCDEKRNKPN